MSSTFSGMGGNAKGLSAQAPDFLRHRFEVGEFPAGNGHIRSRICKRERNGPADASTSTRDEGYFSFKSKK
jgi:hypothetical protein